MQQRFLMQILLLAQHVSGITMAITRSPRVLYSGCCVWYFVLWFFKQLVWCGAEGYASGLQDAGLLHLVGILFPHINDDARSKSHQICTFLYPADHDMSYFSLLKIHVISAYRYPHHTLNVSSISHNSLCLLLTDPRPVHVGPVVWVMWHRAVAYREGGFGVFKPPPKF